MIRYRSHKQLCLAEFDWPFQTALDGDNRWVKMSQCIPWDDLAEGDYRGLSVRAGRPAKDARLVIGAVIIKHKLCLSEEETVQQIQENPYLHYFVGLPGYQMAAPFAPSVFEVFHGAIIEAVEEARATRKSSRSRPSSVKEESEEDHDDDPPPSSGEVRQTQEPVGLLKLI